MNFAKVVLKLPNRWLGIVVYFVRTLLVSSVIPLSQAARRGAQIRHSILGSYDFALIASESPNDVAVSLIFF